MGAIITNRARLLTHQRSDILAKCRVNQMEYRMPNDTLSFIQRLQEYGVFGYLVMLALSIWAGTVRYLTSLKGTRPTVWGWLTETMISGFVGIITGMTCMYFDLAPLLTYVITGISAHNGTRSLYLISEMLKKNSGRMGLTFSAEESPAKAIYSRKRPDGDQ